jgi:hypothetical protein
MNRTLTDTLRIGSLAIQITAPNLWLDEFGWLWKGWMGASGATPWEARILSDANAPEPDPATATRLSFSNDMCTVTGSGYSGIIDPACGYARAVAHPRAQAGDLCIFVRSVLALQAYERGGILFHAAGLVRQGQGYALFGASGSGKTTAARTSMAEAVLNDDLVLLELMGPVWHVSGTPFGGNWEGHKATVPLQALLHLVQADKDRIETLAAGVALGELVANSPVANSHAERLPTLFSRWQSILAHVPVRALHLRKGSAFWRMIDDAFE